MTAQSETPTIDATMVASVCGQASDALDDVRGCLRVCENSLFDMGRDAADGDTGVALIAMARALAAIARLIEWESARVDELAEKAEQLGGSASGE